MVYVSNGGAIVPRRGNWLIQKVRFLCQGIMSDAKAFCFVWPTQSTYATLFNDPTRDSILSCT